MLTLDEWLKIDEKIDVAAEWIKALGGSRAEELQATHVKTPADLIDLRSAMSNEQFHLKMLPRVSTRVKNSEVQSVYVAGS